MKLLEDPEKSLGDLGFTEQSNLMVKIVGDPEQGAKKVVLNIIESEILKHFDSLYDMLDSTEPQARMVYSTP